MSTGREFEVSVRRRESFIIRTGDVVPAKAELMRGRKVRVILFGICCAFLTNTLSRTEWTV